MFDREVTTFLRRPQALLGEHADEREAGGVVASDVGRLKGQRRRSGAPWRIHVEHQTANRRRPPGLR